MTVTQANSRREYYIQKNREAKRARLLAQGLDPDAPEIKAQSTSRTRTPKLFVPGREIAGFSNIIALDFETANFERAACSIGLAHWQDGRMVAAEEILINPESHFDPKAIQVHGITPYDVLNEPAFPHAYQRLMEMLTPDTLVIAHNAKFDMNVLKKNCERYNLPMPEFHYLCTYELSASYFHELPRCGLANLALHIGIDFNHHRALDDAIACLKVLQHVEQDLAGQNKTLDDLFMEKQMRLGLFSGEKPEPFKTGKKAFQLPVPADPNAVTPITGKSFVFAGDLTFYNNKQATKLVVDRGGIIRTRMASTLDYFVVGVPNFWTTAEDFALRVARAEELAQDSNMSVVPEKDFVEILKPIL